MNDYKSKRQILIVSSICSMYLLLSVFYYLIDKYLPGILSFILILLLPTTFIATIVYTIKGLIKIYRNKYSLTFHFCLPTLIAFGTLSYTIFSPWQLDSENWQAGIEMRACYEGTQNQSTIKFREDHTFEIHSTGIFFSSYWNWGKWEKCNDTLFLKFDSQRNRLLSDTIIIHNVFLIPIREISLADSLRNYSKYYYFEK